jgi:hypothetical protein
VAKVSGFPGEGLHGHMEMNRNLGQPDYPATPVMNARLKRVPGGEAKFAKLSL